DGALVRLDVVLGVRWGASVPAVATRVRERVGARVAELTGLTVTDIDVEVVELISPERPPRAR
ncbi:Asp23/Gls24 family envelope stress response protein, partial [Saccharomonospora halophila]|uniref:Asp23/Gls24 family envelope stress response protein n=1 Tax=Saccharomonospora halophila TaxID=129922 RepID=UPI00058520C7